jgi:hypothetical protein
MSILFREKKHPSKQYHISCACVLNRGWWRGMATSVGRIQLLAHAIFVLVLAHLQDTAIAEPEEHHLCDLDRPGRRRDLLPSPCLRTAEDKPNRDEIILNHDGVGLKAQVGKGLSPSADQPP